MPERIVAMLTGDMPEPILVIPYETWKTFELTGGENEFLIADFMAAWSKDFERLFSIRREAKCKTIRYTTMIGRIGTGIIVPKEITQQFGIRMDYYFEVFLKKAVKKKKEIDIFPEREVFDHYPAGFERKLKKE